MNTGRVQCHDRAEYVWFGLRCVLIAPTIAPQAASPSRFIQLHPHMIGLDEAAVSRQVSDLGF
jgi:hypothetical protein